MSQEDLHNSGAVGTQNEEKDKDQVQSPSQKTSSDNANVPTITYSADRVIGHGSFGVVYQATIVQSGETVAIKKVLQDSRYKNRELQIMSLLSHPSVINLKHCFYSNDTSSETYLNLVMEYVPETVYRTIRNHTKSKKHIKSSIVKAAMYQILRSVAYIHSIGVCHRDIKPQNLLYNHRNHVVKLCDFGSAKKLSPEEPNVAYICSRYYRAPELICDATYYTNAVDLWSIGCVFAELLLGSPLFPGETSKEQLIEILKVLGDPTKEEMKKMNPKFDIRSVFENKSYKSYVPIPWKEIFGESRPNPQAYELLSALLKYDPSERIDPFKALALPYFDDLRNESFLLPNGSPPANIHNWTDRELKIMKFYNLTKALIPPYVAKTLLPEQKLLCGWEDEE